MATTLAASAAGRPERVSPFSDKPVLVFWEMTRSCLLSCVHCRASAIRDPLPGELTTEEGFRLIDSVASFGDRKPTVIFTGGDPLLRTDFFEVLSYATKAGVRFAVSPAATEMLSFDTLKRIAQAGASSISLSLDGADASTHDSIRGSEGVYGRTVQAARGAVALGLNPQINTTIMQRNYQELPRIFHLIRSLGIKTWELFFLVKTGRGEGVEDLSPVAVEDVCNFLVDASFYGVTIRCVEGPFIRRVMKTRSERGRSWDHDGYLSLRTELLSAGSPTSERSSLGATGTLDGDGVIFVGYDGSIRPGGLVPVDIGNVRRDDLVKVYRENELLRKIRRREMSGPCGSCEFKDVCGGSRARSYSSFGDPLSSDPACLYASSAGT